MGAEDAVFGLGLPVSPADGVDCGWEPSAGFRQGHEGKTAMRPRQPADAPDDRTADRSQNPSLAERARIVGAQANDLVLLAGTSRS